MSRSKSRSAIAWNFPFGARDLLFQSFHVDASCVHPGYIFVGVLIGDRREQRFDVPSVLCSSRPAHYPSRWKLIGVAECSRCEKSGACAHQAK